MPARVATPSCSVNTETGSPRMFAVDDDDTTIGSDRSRVAVNQHYDSAGFHEIDRLVRYRLTREPAVSALRCASS